MEKLTIDFPETKSALVKQLLKELGVVFQSPGKKDISEVRSKLANVSVWSDKDLQVFEDSKHLTTSHLPILPFTDDVGR